MRLLPILDLRRNPPPAPPPVSPETVQAQALAVNIAREAQERGNDGALGLARASAYQAFHARLAQELGREWPAQ
ncbi:MAG: hypothetical protein ABFE01_03320 [Phycisphaerales bacterium]